MEDGLKITNFLPLVAVSLLLTSCSWLERMERSLVGEEEAPRANSPRSSVASSRGTVSKVEYDELLARYEELNRQHQALKDGRVSSAPLVNELKDTPMISNQTATPSVETVNAFEAPPVATTAMEAGDVEGQLARFRQAQALEASNASEAMKLYQTLAARAVGPIKARSQLRMGQVLMAQGEFDLALQAFEGVIQRMSYSGAVLEALRYAAICSEKLGQTQKKTQYLSMLKDVFQVGV